MWPRDNHDRAAQKIEFFLNELLKCFAIAGVIQWATLIRVLKGKKTNSGQMASSLSKKV